MITDQNFYEICFTVFYPNAFATAEGENCAYGPTLYLPLLILEEQKKINRIHETKLHVWLTYGSTVAFMSFKLKSMVFPIKLTLNDSRL